ncbi:MAG: hypothetical protein ACLU99_03465 [Alphaproteobacteria bacterium]
MSMEWSEPLNIRIGSMLEVQVAELQDGIPVFIPSDKEMFKRPQRQPSNMPHLMALLLFLIIRIK